MGNVHFKAAIQKQEEYVNKEMKTINSNLSYSNEQLRGKLRLEYHGMITPKTKNYYVMHDDWKNLRK